MARLLECPLEQIAKEPVDAAKQATARFNVNVLLKGADTYLAMATGELYHHKGGNIGLATGGSGDALAGLIGGLLARGATIAQGAAHGVYIHAQAGARLAQCLSPLGFLARELLPEFPKLLGELKEESTQ
jgi:NAD(P)H-hydrate repair Nnr-like enzyme with NAD(P)H-hydrate dehydratase domain